MTSHPTQGLPFLPGNSFKDPTKVAFHRSQTLEIRNGFSRALLPTVGIGRDRITANQLSQAELDELANKRPTLTYGQAKPAPPSDFIPAHVAFDKKVLKFDAYFQENVILSQIEKYRIRRVGIYYFLEDDSISIMEPTVINSGLPQGKYMYRQRQPKNDCGDFYHWKDLNIGMNIVIYGKTLRIVNCDPFTQEFLASEGIVLNPPEEIPPDPYTEMRKEPPRTFVTPSQFDKLAQFLSMDRKVLRFYAVWDDTGSMFGEAHRVIIQYYLNDDSVQIREVHERNDGRDPFPVLLRRDRLPKAIKDLRLTFPSCVLELSDKEVADWFTPKHFCVGQQIIILGRKFLIYDCDEYTRCYYRDNFGISDMQSIDVKKPPQEKVKQELPPYNGYGLLEDSIQNCLAIIPQPPKKDVMKMLENDRKVLRYAAVMESINPEDKIRRFVINYFLAYDMMSIFEVQVRNSGIIGGKFLERSKVPKPGSSVDDPCFYGPEDFFIGAAVEVFGHRFIITDTDEYVLTFVEANQDQFSVELLTSLQKHFKGRRHDTNKLICDPSPDTEQTKPAETKDEKSALERTAEQLATVEIVKAAPEMSKTGPGDNTEMQTTGKTSQAHSRGPCIPQICDEHALP